MENPFESLNSSTLLSARDWLPVGNGDVGEDGAGEANGSFPVGVGALSIGEVVLKHAAVREASLGKLTRMIDLKALQNELERFHSPAMSDENHFARALRKEKVPDECSTSGNHVFDAFGTGEFSFPMDFST